MLSLLICTYFYCAYTTPTYQKVDIISNKVNMFVLIIKINPIWISTVGWGMRGQHAVQRQWLYESTCSQMFWKCRVSEHFVFTSYFLVTLYLSSLPCWVVCLSEESKQCQYRRSAVQPVPVLPGLASWVKHRVLILSEIIRSRDRRLNGRNWKTLSFLSRSPKHQGNRKTHLGGQHPRNATKLANI